EGAYSVRSDGRIAHVVARSTARTGKRRIGDVGTQPGDHCCHGRSGSCVLRLKYAKHLKYWPCDCSWSVTPRQRQAFIKTVAAVRDACECEKAAEAALMGLSNQESEQAAGMGR